MHQRRHAPRHQPRTLSEVLGQAIDEDDAATAARVVDFLRFQRGLNYDQCLKLAQSVRPKLTPADWDGLLYVADTTEAIP